MSSILIALISGMILGGLFFGSLTPRAVRKGRLLGGLMYLLIALVLVLTGSVVLLVSAGTRGYKTLTREDTAAVVHFKALGNQQFQATITRPGMRDTVFAIAGDEFYIDARILKWKPFVNFFGIHTVYRLDRISGRYSDINDEIVKVRTLYALDGRMKPWDIFAVRSRCAFLAPLLDAQYGSATFVPVKDTPAARIMVTTSGLIARPLQRAEQ